MNERIVVMEIQVVVMEKEDSGGCYGKRRFRWLLWR